LGSPELDAERLQEQTTRAIESLRRAIVQLRAAQADDVSALSLGFVAAPGARRGPAED